MARILIIDDEDNLRRILSVILQEDGHAVSEAPGVQAALKLLAEQPFDLVMTDQKMPDGEGLSIISACRETDPTLPVVMLTAFATVELAVEAMRQGAFDFISKPFVPEVVRAVARRACERAALLRENARLRDEVSRLSVLDEIIGVSAAIRTLKENIARVAPTGATVLITGETGTGKELVARAIHKGSARAAQPFVAVNCAAIQESLLESELFGHERGAFTGADRSRQGLFEAAHRGTLFLDEAGEMSLPLQAKLLRVLMDGQILRVGSTTPRKVDVRVIAATHRDLLKLIREGAFREDLFYRLAVVPLSIPPLRSRPEDIPLLIEHISRQVARDLKSQPRRLSAAATAKLLQYCFPGNVRELRNLIERAFILAQGAEIGPADLLLSDERTAQASEPQADPFQQWLASMPAEISLRETLETTERELIRRALQAANGVQAEAARHLGVTRSDIGYKIRKYGLEAETAS
ncbi:MAG TPA: sigma-54 dependent transcriptional regulator [Blastocatellia bacterium]|nr:sigma-54 dependent transcriptional regulator [Blastocatellia bacterium]